MRALLDINVLIALMDAQHIHHDLAQRWLASNIAFGWASCPITQNGFIRIVSQPAFPNPVTLGEAAERLQEACNTEWHEYWPDDISLIEADRIDWSHVLGNRQVTDTYLLALAVQHRGRFVTLDQRVALRAVHDATSQHLEVIG